MKNILIIIILTLLYIQGIAQNSDSLWAVWKDEKQPDTTRLDAIQDAIWNDYLFNQTDSAIYYAGIQYDFAKKRGLKKQMGWALNTLGISYQIKGNYAKTIEYYAQNLKLFEDIGNKNGIASTLSNIGLVYETQEDFTKAIEYFSKSLKIAEDIENKKIVAGSLINIGAAYLRQEDYTKALNYFNKGIIICDEINEKEFKANALNNIGNIYSKKENYTFSIVYFQQALRINEEIGDKISIASVLTNLGNTYQSMGNYVKANTYSKRALNLAKEIEAIEETLDAAKSLWKIYKKTGKYRQALEMHELYIQMRDSILSKENKKEVIRQEYKYEYEKKEAITLAKQEKKDALAKKELEKQTMQRNGFIIGFILMLALAGVVFRSYRNKQKANTIISLQKHEVETQKHIIEEKHKEITDSINYAERIQRSFLATREMLDEYLVDYFVFFKPKDVVSGDFYWASILNNGDFAFCCADSTGHGVPGAIMSILNISSLEKSIEIQTEPHEILYETRKIIINRLKKDGSLEGGKDGMDCSLLVLNKDKTQLTFASAHNPVFIIRNQEIIEFKGDKMPVGKHEKENEAFTLHAITLQKGDIIYALTDGYPDQFGGDKGKKYMIKRLKELFLQIAHLSMKEQQQKLAEEFASWKGENEQVDDVCIVGVRV